MHTLRDIRDFRDGSYGLVETYNKFHNKKSSRSFGHAEHEWKSVVSRLDERLTGWYGGRWIEKEWPMIPVMAAFRHAYADMFEIMPDDGVECAQILQDAIVTLNSIEQLDSASPFLAGRPPHPLMRTLDDGVFGDEHIDSAVALNEQFTKRWNERRKKQNKHSVALPPLDERQLRHMVLGRPDTEAVKMSVSGHDDEVSGYFVLRAPYEDGDRGLDVIALAVDDEPGYADALASLLILRIEYETQKRVKNLVEATHRDRP